MMFYKFFCIFNRKAKISKKLIFDKPEVPMTVRVLLDKPPDIVIPTVWGQILFGVIINSTYPGGLPNIKSLDLGACTVPWGVHQVLWL